MYYPGQLGRYSDTAYVDDGYPVVVVAVVVAADCLRSVLYTKVPYGSPGRNEGRMDGLVFPEPFMRIRSVKITYIQAEVAQCYLLRMSVRRG